MINLFFLFFFPFLILC